MRLSTPLNPKGLFPYLVTASLVALSAYLPSSAFAYAAVIGLSLTLAQEALKSYLETRVFKNTVPEEAKRKLQDIEARLTTVEMGIQRRGF